MSDSLVERFREGLRGRSDLELGEMALGSPAVHFATCIQIHNKDNVPIRPVPNILQLRMSEVYEVCMALGVPCRMVVCKPRQVGCSTFGSHIVYHHGMRWRTAGITISDKSGNSQKLMMKVRDYGVVDRFPWGIRQLKDTSVGLSWTNGTRWEVDSAENWKAGIGDTRQAFHASECAKWPKTGVKNDKRVMSAVLPSISKGRSVVVAESTPEGACYDNQTDVLTDQGWKRFADLDGSEAILTKDPVTGRSYFQREWIPQVHDYCGDMVRVSNRTVDLVVTPNHQMWAGLQKGEMRFMSAGDMIGRKTDFYFDRTTDLSGPGMDEFVLPAWSYRKGCADGKGPGGVIRHKVVDVECGEKRIPINVWLRFLGYWLADGNVLHRKKGSGGNHRRVCLTQVKYADRFREAVAALCEHLGVWYAEKDHQNGKRWEINCGQLSSYLSAFSQPKKIPRDLLDGMSRDQCRMLMDAIYEGDGDAYHRNNYSIDRGRVYVGVDKEFEDTLQELAIRCGYSTSGHGPERNRVVMFSSKEKAKVCCNNGPVLEHGYNGKVYCVTLPKDHLLMVRRGRKAVWCGNSGWMYETWQESVGLDEFMRRRESGEDVGVMWIKVFAAWYEFEEHCRREKVKDHERVEMERSLSDREAALLEKGITWEQLAWRRDIMRTECGGSEDVFDEYYPEDDVRCWAVSGRPRFDVEALMAMERRARGMSAMTGHLVQQEGGAVTWSGRTDGGGDIQVWEEPREGLRYLVACDPATGESQTTGKDPDRTSIQVWRQGYYDPGTGIEHRTRMVARVRSPFFGDGDEVAGHLLRLSKWYGGAIVVIEVNMGIHVVDRCKEAGIPLYQRRVPSARIGSEVMQYGYKLKDPEQRRAAVDALAVAIREQVLDVSCLDWIREAKMFVVAKNGREEARGGEHDDDVLCASMAWSSMASATEYRRVIRRRRKPADWKDWKRVGSVGRGY